VTKREGPLVPTHIPTELQQRYGAEARRQVRARRRGRSKPTGQRATGPRLGQSALVAGTVLLAATLAMVLGIVASSWLVGVIMLLTLTALGLIGFGVRSTVRAHSTKDLAPDPE
jgi:Flp pilus assembly protein TadB